MGEPSLHDFLQILFLALVSLCHRSPYSCKLPPSDCLIQKELRYTNTFSTYCRKGEKIQARPPEITCSLILCLRDSTAVCGVVFVAPPLPPPAHTASTHCVCALFHTPFRGHTSEPEKVPAVMELTVHRLDKEENFQGCTILCRQSVCRDSDGLGDSCGLEVRKASPRRGHLSHDLTDKGLLAMGR